MAIVMTVRGAVAPQDLGLTLSHEHLITCPPEWWLQRDDDHLLPSVPMALDELHAFARAGGGTVIEWTAIDYGHNPFALRAIAAHTPVHIVAATGFNRGIFYEEWVTKATEEELADLLTTHITQGLYGSGVRAGLLKTGTDYNFIAQHEHRTLLATAIAQQRTGVAVGGHCTHGTWGIEHARVLLDAGVPPLRIALAHLDQNLDYGYLTELAATGIYLGFDGLSKVKYGTDGARIGMLRRLIEHGYLHQLLLSCDMGRRSYWQAYGGGPGFTFIPLHFVPRLRREGFSEHEIEVLTKDNPANWIAFEPRFDLSASRLASVSPVERAAADQNRRRAAGNFPWPPAGAEVTTPSTKAPL